MLNKNLSMAGLRVASLALAGSLVAVAPVQAQGLVDIGRFIIGLPAEEKAPIEYRERAPLVVPPNQNLRPPVDASTPDQRRANWPQDPDVLARRKAADEPRMVDAITGRELPPAPRMSIDDVRAGRVAGQEVVRVPEPISTDESRANIMGGLRTLRELDKQASAESNGNLSRQEPRREFLTEPPSGLRRPADNAPFRATREGSLGARPEVSPLDIFKEQPNTR
jgi:hypothetical protein